MIEYDPYEMAEARVNILYALHAIDKRKKQLFGDAEVDDRIGFGATKSDLIEHFDILARENDQISPFRVVSSRWLKFIRNKFRDSESQITADYNSRTLGEAAIRGLIEDGCITAKPVTPDQIGSTYRSQDNDTNVIYHIREAIKSE